MKSRFEMARWAGQMLPALGLLVSLACGGGGGSAAPTPAPTPTPSFTLYAAPSSLSLVQGTAGSASLSIIPKDGFTGSVTASAANLPTGVTASFNPASTTTATAVTFAVAAATVPGTYSITLNGVAAGASSAAATMSLQVTASSVPSFSLAMNPAGPLTLAAGSSGNVGVQVAGQNGFAGPVAFSVSGLPAGVTGTFSPASSPTASTLLVTVGATVAAGTYPFTVKGTSAGVTDATLTGSLVVTTVAQPSFSLTQSPAGPLALVAGTSGTLGVQVAGQNGFTAAVAFSVSGLPASVTGTFNPASSTSASTLQVSVGASVTAGTYPFTIKGTSAGVADATLTGSLVVSNVVTGTTDVYIAGYVNPSLPIAGYWKNGVAVALSDGSKTAVAYAVTVSSGDVYVAGYEADGNSYVTNLGVIDRYRVAKVWKNGAVTRLSDGTYHAEAHAVAVSGTDVYVAGREATTHSSTGGYSGFSVAKIWKNGVGTALTSPAGFAQASAIAFSGSDVYLAGYQQVGSTYQTALYWKNNTAVMLTDGSTVAEATGIAVSGTDIYVSGHQETATGTKIAKQWKNGVATTLSNGAQSDYGTGIALNGTDVLVSGSQAYLAMLWQNAQPIALSDTSAVAQTLAVTVSNGTVWLCGTYNNKAAYWDKNRQGWKLTDGTESLSSANGIFVVTH